MAGGGVVEETGVRLADVEGDLREVCAVDKEFCRILHIKSAQNFRG